MIPAGAGPVGVLHDTVVSETGPDDADPTDYDGDPRLADWSPEERASLRSNHRHQLAAHVRGLAAPAPEQPMIHVADLEFDDTPAMAEARQVHHHFVFRVLGNRTVLVKDDQGQTVLVLRCGGWSGRRTDPIGPTVPMRGMCQLMTMFSMLNQFPDLRACLAKHFGGNRKNA